MHLQRCVYLFNSQLPCSHCWLEEGAFFQDVLRFCMDIGNKECSRDWWLGEYMSHHWMPTLNWYKILSSVMQRGMVQECRGSISHSGCGCIQLENHVTTKNKIWWQAHTITMHIYTRMRICVWVCVRAYARAHTHNTNTKCLDSIHVRNLAFMHTPILVHTLHTAINKKGPRSIKAHHLQDVDRRFWVEQRAHSFAYLEI